MTELQKSRFNQLVEFVSLDLTGFGDTTYYYCNSSTFENADPNVNTVTWQGNEWSCVPFTSTGWQRGGDQLVRPSITVPDFTGVLYTTLRKYNLAPGAPIKRIRALYQDVVSDQSYGGFQIEQYVVNTVSGNGRILTIELATQIDFQQSKTPSFIMTREFYPGLGSALLRK